MERTAALTRAARDRSWEVFTSRHRNAMWATVAVVAALGLHQIAKRLDI